MPPIGGILPQLFARLFAAARTVAKDDKGNGVAPLQEKAEQPPTATDPKLTAPSPPQTPALWKAQKPQPKWLENLPKPLEDVYGFTVFGGEPPGDSGLGLRNLLLISEAKPYRITVSDHSTTRISPNNRFSVVQLQLTSGESKKECRSNFPVWEFSRKVLHTSSK